MTNIVGIIPSRYASTRFPAKPLVGIEGKTMIQRVYEQASKAHKLSRVIVATDDQRIFDHVKEFGGDVMMTSPEHQTGTDRCAEVLAQLTNVDVVINIQGDEPFIDPEQIDQVAELFERAETQIGSLVKEIEDEEDLFSDTVVKVVRSKTDQAIYFSRAAIPFIKGVEKKEWMKSATYYKHIGIYGYRATVLESISKLPQTNLEKSESLEQLRWLENGYTIQLAETEHESNSVDTPEDLDRLLDKMVIRENEKSNRH
ncbi:MAG: 3-deoxy-manno-octulosonate cytidylyltransferase [Flavobacteriales bacterium]|nr:3-deoxy-manno-octulosonate cytidylyltransferase [Flavobacteriales bacterium]MCB9192734.1 3-deoxy-manno-octulosonate cytidylyltransferase [Flavobacteriales bacterium]